MKTKKTCRLHPFPQNEHPREIDHLKGASCGALPPPLWVGFFDVVSEAKADLWIEGLPHRTILMSPMWF